MMNRSNSKSRPHEPLSFVLTGRLSKVRQDIVRDIENAGAAYLPRITNKQVPTYLVVGETNDGADTQKLAEANDRGIPTIDEQGLYDLLNKHHRSTSHKSAKRNMPSSVSKSQKNIVKTTSGSNTTKTRPPLLKKKHSSTTTKHNSTSGRSHHSNPSPYNHMTQEEIEEEEEDDDYNSDDASDYLSDTVSVDSQSNDYDQEPVRNNAQYKSSNLVVQNTRYNADGNNMEYVFLYPTPLDNHFVTVTIRNNVHMNDVLDDLASAGRVRVVKPNTMRKRWVTDFIKMANTPSVDTNEIDLNDIVENRAVANLK